MVLGSNVGDRLSYLKKACQCLKNLLPLNFQVSPVFETAPWGVRHQKGYYNLAVSATTAYGPFQLLNLFRKLERQYGRKTKGDYKPRTLDIDIILLGDVVITSEQLTIPHRNMHERKFVLAPINCISPATMHPIYQKNIADLLKQCSDNGKIIQLNDRIFSN